MQQLLERLKLSETETVYFFTQESKWRAIVTPDTAKKLEQIKPTAFYLFNNQPYILFFDLSGSLYQKDRESEIHKKVWSFDQSPIAFVLKDEDIEIYNAFAYEKKKEKLQQINLDDGQRDEMFSFWNLQSGNTWKWIKDEYYKNTINQKRVSQKLFDNIKVVRERLTADQNLTDDESNTLILRLIFIRYLIDRNIKLPIEFIKGNSINERRVSFIELIRKPRILNKFFTELNNKFNGVLFKNIHFELSKEQAVALADVFSGEVVAQGSLFYGTDFFFEIFDFSIIPVELISGIYESLIDPETRKLQSAVYTPSFLVEYMLNETVDEYFAKHDSNTTECKIFDPSVGSGIFLVQAYRRMVEREFEKEKGKKISKVRLREIAVNNLFGIDINEQALKVTCFSIYIAMLDYIDPASILVSFKFPDLIGYNLFEADFFDSSHPYNKKIISENVDFLLGNPPWKSDKNDYHINWLKTNNKVVGRYEIAQSFLLRSKDFMTPSTISALIVTSTIFYNISTPAKKFKAEFLTSFCINSFFDLSPVRRLVFEEKDNPCSIIFYHLSSGDNHLSNVVKHQSIKSNIFLKHFKTLIIEKFDQKRILQKHFINNDWMFKVALYGSTLDYNLIHSIEKKGPLIRDLIDNKIIFKGGGIHKGTKGKYEPFFPILNKPIIENFEINKIFSCSNENKIVKQDDIYIKSGRENGIFEGTQILIKEQAKNESEIVISFTDKPYVIRSGIFSIASKSNKQFIELLFSYMITSLYEYYIYMTAGSWGVSTRPQIRLDEEFLSFPFIKANDNVQGQLIQLVNRILKPYQEFYSEFNLGEPLKDLKAEFEINKIIENLYDIEGYKKDLIDYTLNISRYQFQESKQHRIIRKVNNDQSVINQYVSIFIEEFCDIYKDEYLRIDVYSLDYFIAINFVFQDERPDKEINFIKDITDTSSIFKILSNNLSIVQKTNDLYIQKDVKGFEENSFYIIKPNEYKCWHRAIAWYDIAEIKDTIEAAEIDYLKNDWHVS